MRHTNLPKDAWKRITTEYYDCGHMLYINPKVLSGLARNMNQVIPKASSTG